MTHIEIRTQAKAELHPFPSFQYAKYLEFKGVNIVQGATSKGQSFVELFFEDQQGNKYIAGTTGKMLVNGIAAAVRGTMERFGDDLINP